MFQSFEYAARLRPTATALVTTGRQCTYGEALQAVNAIALRLHDAGVRSGHRVAIPLAEPASLFCQMALAKIGACSAVGYRGEPWMHWFITDTASQDPKAIHIPASAFTDPDGPDSGEDLPVHAWQPGEEAALKLSSGSTGKPKWIMRSHASEMAGLAINRTSFTYGPGIVCAHALGFSGAANTIKLNVWMTGSTLALFSPSRPQVLEEMDALGVTRLCISPANMGHALRTAAAVHPRPGLTVALFGGRAPAPLLERISRTLTPNIVLTYGTTETGLCAIAYLQGGPAPRMTCGYVPPLARVQVAGPDGQPVATGETGRIHIGVHAPGRDGYLDDAGAIVPFTLSDPVWFHTGDTGHFDAEGALHVHGRDDDVAVLGGRKVQMAEIEDAAQRTGLTVEQAALNAPLAGGQSGVFLAVVLKPGATGPALKQALKLAMPLAAGVKLVVVPSLPRVANSKVDFVKLRRNIGLAVRRKAAGAGR